MTVVEGMGLHPLRIDLSFFSRSSFAAGGAGAIEMCERRKGVRRGELWTRFASCDCLCALTCITGTEGATQNTCVTIEQQRRAVKAFD